jgi:hypothetical protein
LRDTIILSVERQLVGGLVLWMWVSCNDHARV